MIFVSLIIVIINAKPCAWLMALLTKIMRCILQVRAQEQPVHMYSNPQTSRLIYEASFEKVKFVAPKKVGPQ